MDELCENFHLQIIEGYRFNVPKRYIDLAPLGAGSQGVCCSGKDTILERGVAIKRLFRLFRNKRQAKYAYRELKLLLLFNHKNVIGLLDVFTPQKSLRDFQDVYLVMELMDGNLSQVMNTDLNHERISFLLYQLFCGIKHLNSAGIIHRDLKPSNISINERCELKILDLGLARKIDDNINMTPYVVTRYYRSPEVILGMKYGPNVDIWSVGCIMAEMIRGKVMFQGTDHLNQWDKITSLLGTPSSDFIDRLKPTVREFVRSRPIHERIPFQRLFSDDYFPENSMQNPQLNAITALDLISKMLVIDPEHRISVDGALNHVYIRLWYSDKEVNCPPAAVYDNTFDSHDLSICHYKRLMYDLIKKYESSKLKN